MIFDGRWAPKRIVDTFVASEKVGEGGPGDVLRLEVKLSASSDFGAMAGCVRRLNYFQHRAVHACIFYLCDMTTSLLLPYVISEFLVLIMTIKATNDCVGDPELNTDHRLKTSNKTAELMWSSCL